MKLVKTLLVMTALTSSAALAGTGQIGSAGVNLVTVLNKKITPTAKTVLNMQSIAILKQTDSATLKLISNTRFAEVTTIKGNRVVNVESVPADVAGEDSGTQMTLVKGKVNFLGFESNATVSKNAAGAVSAVKISGAEFLKALQANAKTSGQSIYEALADSVNIGSLDKEHIHSASLSVKDITCELKTNLVICESSIIMTIDGRQE